MEDSAAEEKRKSVRVHLQVQKELGEEWCSRVLALIEEKVQQVAAIQELCWGVEVTIMEGNDENYAKKYLNKEPKRVA